MCNNISVPSTTQDTEDTEPPMAVALGAPGDLGGFPLDGVDPSDLTKTSDGFSTEAHRVRGELWVSR
jgi:hypothetical protein